MTILIANNETFFRSGGFIMSKVLLIIKGLGNRQAHSLLMKAGAGLMVAAMVTVGLISVSYSDKVNKGLADNLIRLHVVANSDSEADQDLKRDVRDAVIGYMKEQLKNSKDVEQTKQIIGENLDKIAQVAKAEIKRQGKDYEVKAMLGSYPFPTKVYGDVSLPAGQYQALKVVIGKGEGANWWCVLFPPLCFVDATHGTIPDSVKEDLRKALTEEEYSIITSADDDSDIPIKVKFKVVEVLQNSKIKFTGIISNLFKSRE